MASSVTDVQQPAAHGTICRITSNRAYELVHEFAGFDSGHYPEGFAPVDGLTLGLDGNFYEATNSGGTAGDFPPGSWHDLQG